MCAECNESEIIQKKWLNKYWVCLLKVYAIPLCSEYNNANPHPTSREYPILWRTLFVYKKNYFIAECVNKLS